MSVEIVVSDANTHTGLFHAIIAQRNPTHHAFFAESSIMVVHEKKAGSGIAGNEDVGPSIFVEISGNYRHPITLRSGGDACLLGNFSEGPIPVVAIKRMSTRREAARTAVDRDTLPIAGGVLSRRRSVLK